jgi:hypothetical protein
MHMNRRIRSTQLWPSGPSTDSAGKIVPGGPDRLLDIPASIVWMCLADALSLHVGTLLSLTCSVDLRSVRVLTCRTLAKPPGLMTLSVVYMAVAAVFCPPADRQGYVRCRVPSVQLLSHMSGAVNSAHLLAVCAFRVCFAPEILQHSDVQWAEGGGLTDRARCSDTPSCGACTPVP